MSNSRVFQQSVKALSRRLSILLCGPKARWPSMTSCIQTSHHVIPVDLSMRNQKGVVGCVQCVQCVHRQGLYHFPDFRTEWRACEVRLKRRVPHAEAFVAFVASPQGFMYKHQWKIPDDTGWCIMNLSFYQDLSSYTLRLCEGISNTFKIGLRLSWQFEWGTCLQSYGRTVPRPDPKQLLSTFDWLPWCRLDWPLTATH